MHFYIYNFYIIKKNLDKTIKVKNNSFKLKRFRIRLEKFPSATIYHEKTGELACFQMVDGIGFIAPRFTRCKYSVYGLVFAILLKISEIYLF